MLNKNGKVITTAITLIDVHDIARSCKTFGVENFYIEHPSEALHKLTAKLSYHWRKGYGASYNPDRKEALDIVKIKKSFSEIIGDIKEKSQGTPLVIGTSARNNFKEKEVISMKELAKVVEEKSVLLCFGTGWGFSPELINKMECMLEPIKGAQEYNHLSVRSAAAIILSRLWEESKPRTA